MMESDDYVPQFSQMGDDPSSMAFTDFSPDSYSAPGQGVNNMGGMSGGHSAMIAGQPPPQHHHQQQHAAMQASMYYQQHNPHLQHQHPSGHFVSGHPHPEPPSVPNPSAHGIGSSGGSIFDPVFMGTAPAQAPKGGGKGGGGKKKGAGGTKATKKQQQQQQQQLQQQSQPNFPSQMPPQQQFMGSAAPNRMQMMSPQQQHVQQGYGPQHGYPGYPNQQQQSYGQISSGMQSAGQQPQSVAGYNAYGSNPAMHQQPQHPYPVPYQPPGMHRPQMMASGQGQMQPSAFPAANAIQRQPMSASNYVMKQEAPNPGYQAPTPIPQSSREAVQQQQQLQQGAFQSSSMYGNDQQQQQNVNRPNYGQQHSGSSYPTPAMYQQQSSQQQQQQSYGGFGPSATTGAGEYGTSGIRMNTPVPSAQQQQQQHYSTQMQQSGGYPMHSSYPQHQPPSGTYNSGSGSGNSGYQQMDTNASNAESSQYGTASQQQQTMYYRQNQPTAATGSSQIMRPPVNPQMVRPPTWPGASDTVGPRMQPPTGMPNQQQNAGYPSQMYGQSQSLPPQQQQQQQQSQQQPLYNRPNQTTPQASTAGQTPTPASMSSINHLQSVLEYSLPDNRLNAGKPLPPAIRPLYPVPGQTAPNAYPGTPASQQYSSQKSNVSPPPPTPRPKTPLTMNANTPTGYQGGGSGMLSPSPAIQQISPAGSGPSMMGPTPGGPVMPGGTNTTTQGGPTTSLSVVMPSDHRGPAVQLNIQPNSQPTTLITLYQLPPGSQHPSTGMIQSHQQQQPQQSAHIPPEPIPSNITPPAGTNLRRNLNQPPPYFHQDSTSSMNINATPGMAPNFELFSQETSSTAPTTGKGSKKKSRAKASTPVAQGPDTPVPAMSPPKKATTWKRKRTAPTPAILPDDDGDGATAAAVAAIAEVAAQPLPPKQRKRESKKMSITQQQSQELVMAPEPSGISSELERILASETPAYGQLNIGSDLPPPPPMSSGFLFRDSDSQHEEQFGQHRVEESEEQKSSEERNQPMSLIPNTVTDVGEIQNTSASSLASIGSPATGTTSNICVDSKSDIQLSDSSFENQGHQKECVKTECNTEESYADQAEKMTSNGNEEGSVPSEEPFSQTAELTGQYDQHQIDPSASISHLDDSENMLNASHIPNDSINQQIDAGLEDDHAESNGTEDFLSMAPTTTINTSTIASSNTPKRRSKKGLIKDEDGAEPTSSPSTSSTTKKRSKTPKEPKEPKPKKTPITSKYAGGKRAKKKKRRSAMVFYSDESEEDEDESSASLMKRSPKKQFVMPKRASVGGKKKSKKGGGDVACQLTLLERRTTSSSDLGANTGDGQTSMDMSQAAVDVAADGTDFELGHSQVATTNADELNLAAFTETRRSCRVTKKKQYVEDWDYGISGSDDERKSPDPNSSRPTLKSNRSSKTNLGKGESAEQEEQVNEQPVYDPKDPAAAYFFLDNPPAEDSHIVEKILGCRTRKPSHDRHSKPDDDQTALPPKEVEEFFVKYKNFSYLHCEWKTVEELEVGDKRIHQKVKRFRQKHRQALFLDEFDEDEPFNPDYITVDRVLDVSTSLALVEEESPKKPDAEVKQEDVEPKKTDESQLHGSDNTAEDTIEKPNADESSKPNSDESIDNVEKMENIDTPDTAPKPEEESQHGQDDSTAEAQTSSHVESEPKPKLQPKYKTVTHYLVKWRCLPYEECTWELEADVDPIKIAEFYSRRIPPTDLKEKSRPRADDWKKVPDTTTYKNGNKLRDYQMEGISWLLFCWHNRQNCILADEMGLGKTIQTITFLVEVQKCGIRGPFLIIAPLSTIMNWQREFETWSDMNAVVYHGTSASRRMIQEYEMYYKNDAGERVTNFFKYNALITTYEMILTDCELLKEIPWRVCVIDEAHRLKNRNCKLLTGLATYRMEHRVLLTGTPLQNNIEELFSLLNFLEPRQFSNSQLFLTEFGQLQTDDQVQKLQEILKPMMLRRLKEDVEKSLKPKEETIIEVELTNIQKKYYRAILERNFTYLSKGANVPSLMNTMMELRKCCNHPFLITGAEEAILAEYRALHNASADDDDLYLNATIQSSGKLVLIDKLLPRLRASGHKVLVFSQMVKCLDILEEYLVHKKFPFERIDGNVRGDMRQAAIDRFCKPDSDRFVFLLCTRAGGLGINLTAADTVIIFDSDWNPQNDLQAQARCHRIGQEKFVKVYRLITRQSYEREMFDKASVKLGLDKAVLQSMGPNKENASAQLSKKEIEELLRKGAYGAIMDENNEGDRFCEEDIDQILQRRTQTITIQAGVKGSTFAKASFAVSSNRSDIDVNDPNFWQKWARKANVDPDFNPEKDLILYEPRQRKRRFADEEHGKGDATDDDSEHEKGSDSDSASDSRKVRAKNRNRKRARAIAAEQREQDDDSDYPDELAFTKSDYFKVEKYLSMFGWGRWKEILKYCNFKQSISENDVKAMCRTVLLHCLRQYHGDEKIKEFVWQLITPPEDGGKTKDDIRSHQGLFGPVPRGRKGNTGRQGSSKGELLMDIYHQGWAALPTYNPPALAVDYGYERHLQRHANKVLLRVRLLYYLEHEVIGPWAEKILSGADSRELDLQLPWHPEVPAPWWDGEADKSLLIGIFKHGFENFDAMRSDPTMIFLERCGPLRSSTETSTDAVQNEEGVEQKEEGESVVSKNVDNDEPVERMEVDSVLKIEEIESAEKPDQKDEPAIEKEKTDNEANDSTKDPNSAVGSDQVGTDQVEYLPFPSVADLNGRFRRLITLCQRSSKVSYMKEEQKAKKMARQEQMQAVLQEREMRKLEERQRWSRREESDFYRALVNFGVDQDPDTGEYVWNRFKQLARLEAKYDHTLTDHCVAFMAMCKRVCKKQLSDEEQRLSFIPEALTEERANKVLQRVELMSRVRQVLAAARNDLPTLDEKLKLSKRTPDFPSWWETGKHDLELLRGIAKHGLNRSEEFVVQDPEFVFYDIWKSYQKESILHTPPTRAMTRTLAKISGSKKDDQKQDDSTEGEPEPMESTAASGNGDAEATISQILAQQTGAFLQWPKERAIIFRLQNICHLIEKGEWPTPRAYTLLDSAMGDQGSSTPDTPAADTPGPCDFDTPTASLTTSASRKDHHSSQQAISTSTANAMLTSAFGLPLTANGTLKLDTFSDLAAAAAAAAFPLTGASGLGSIGRQQPSNAGAGRGQSSRSNARGRKRRHPMQDLMETERERMRALMHQSFLQQLEQFSFAGGLTLPLASSVSSPPPQTSASSSGRHKPNSPSAAGSDDQQVLNLSTKPKKESQSSKDKRSASSAGWDQQDEDSAKPLPFNDLAAMASLPPDTRVPVINIRDGRRLAGRDAPTLRNLAAWLSDNPEFIIDMPPPTPAMINALTSTPSPSAGTFILDTELEPGEIVRSAGMRTRSPLTSESPNVDPSQQHVTVWNRKNGLKLTGTKAPTLNNLAMWLEKNPDWDVDPSCMDLAKKIKLPEKLKSTNHSGHSTSKRSSQRGESSSTSASSKSTTSAPTTQAMPSLSNQATADPIAALLAATMAGMDPLQLSMLFPYGGANPAMLGFGSSSTAANPFGAMNPMSIFGAVPTSVANSSPPPILQPQSTGSSSKKESKNSSKSSAAAEQQKKSQQLQQQQQQQLQQQQDDANALAAAMNPFLFPGMAAAAGIFGLNPFLASTGGMMPTMGFPPPNMAAMAQLQALMGLQGMDSFMNPNTSISGTTSSSGSGGGTISKHGTSSAISTSNQATSSASSTSASSSKSTQQSSKATSSASARASGSGGQGKLNALVNKLVAAETKKRQQRSATSRKDATDNDEVTTPPELDEEHE